MAYPRFSPRLAPILAVCLILAGAGTAEARRGGGFGSRGARTYQAPPPTALAPGATAPITRSMTSAPRPSAAHPRFSQPQRQGLFGGFGGGLLGGLLLGGIVGGLMGHGFGLGGAGLLTMLVQAVALVLAISFVTRLFRRGPQVRVAGSQSSSFFAPSLQPLAPRPRPDTEFSNRSSAVAAPIRVDQQDMDTFERLLIEIQDAFSREDYPALRQRTTPEVMSFLSEELSQNAINDRKNEVTGARLIQQDLAEAWREPDAEYATVAMQFESIDVMRDRRTGQIVEGDSLHPSQTTEIWTFSRKEEGPQNPIWKLSAIQETS